MSAPGAHSSKYSNGLYWIGNVSEIDSVSNNLKVTIVNPTVASRSYDDVMIFGGYQV